MTQEDIRKIEEKVRRHKELAARNKRPEAINRVLTTLIEMRQYEGVPDWDFIFDTYIHLMNHSGLSEQQKAFVDCGLAFQLIRATYDPERWGDIDLIDTTREELETLRKAVVKLEDEIDSRRKHTSL